MIFPDNMHLLQQKNRNLYKKLGEINGKVEEAILIEVAKNGNETLIIKEERNHYYVHSKYNPLKEAESFIQKYSELNKYEHILFIGTGLGYHIKLILDANPTIKFSVFEPNAAVLSVFLERFELKKYKKRIVEIFTSIDEIYNKQVFFKYYSEYAIDISLPITKQLYNDQIREFHKELGQVMENKKEYMRVNSQLQQRWSINSIINFPKLLQTPNLLIDLDKEKLKNKPVIIVAAGPSLAQDLKYIQQIKEEGRAYIFAVGSAINALIAKDIYPDAFFSVDPNYENQFVAEKLKEKNLDIPLVFGSTIGFEVLNGYPGKMISFMLNQDKFSEYLLEYDEGIVVYDAVTVANMTLQALMKLEMQPIIFAGQNLAYLNNKKYSEGIDYKFNPREISEQQIENQKYTISVTGEKLATWDEYLKMKENLEYYIARNNHIEFINTTKNGAHIEGTRFMTIESVINNVLTQTDIIPKNWSAGESSYNLDFAKENFNKLERSFDELLKLSNKCLEYLDTINHMNKTALYKKLEVYLTAFDKLFELIQENDFFKVIIQPMTRVQHEQFIINSPKIAKMRLPREKVNLFDEIFGSYMKTIYSAIVYVQPAFYELKQQGFK
ncbi:motility associated factor glycosyltransferase family protein [Lysinibacillus sp. NPDC056185]|uniref:motility associated factor glycosyltransferase family protein n=1 Tax=Lysinibacillus sp. NPDC056185 TaxID=3345739 RepID=UPI0039EE6227